MSTSRLRFALGLFVGLANVSAAWAAEPNAAWLDRIDVADLKRHASFLASDTLEGRQSGTRGSQAAAAYLAAELRKAGLAPAGSGNDYRQPFGNRYTNVVARLPGNDPTLCDEIIVIGAHYDHVGYGTASNSFGPLGVIHNGADDNASGVSALLEIAEAVAQSDTPPARTVVFGFWDGEEVALLGSQHWVAITPNVATTVKFALNLDMIGRLRDEGVQVMGWRSAAGLRTALSAANASEQIPFQFGTVVTPDSDHQSFYVARVPVLHFDTGKHDDYHRPTDDVERLNWTGLRQIARVAAQIITRAANAESLPMFRREAFHERIPTTAKADERTAPPVRFGFTWRPDRIKEGIVEVAQVVPGYPAALAGLLPGDRLLQFGRWNSGTLAELRTEITRSPSETAITWQRAGEPSPRAAALRLLGDPVRWGATGRVDAALPGCILVADVVETSPAETAGLLPGDIVVELDDRAVSQETWDRLATSTEAATLVIERAGRRRTIIAKPDQFSDSARETVTARDASSE
ncbi:MAG TPA: M20/M25/M40 family metallo-hydrolase [Planctomycetaceae bacterium]|nr:M20/M25/M40 family metallo-hydrolase [Planctomycetaceae bacterium]